MENGTMIQREKKTQTQSKYVRFHPTLPTNASCQWNKLQEKVPPTDGDEDDDRRAGHEALIFVYGHNVNIYHDVFNIPETASLKQIRESYAGLLRQLKTWKDCCIRKSIPDASLAYLTGMRLSQIESGISVITYIEIKTDAIRRAYQILADSTTRCEYDKYLKGYLQELRTESLQKVKQRQQKNVGIDPEGVGSNWFGDFDTLFPVSSEGNSDAFDSFKLKNDGFTNSSTSKHEEEETEAISLKPELRKSEVPQNQPRKMSAMEEIQCTGESTVFICSLPKRSRVDAKEILTDISKDQDETELDNILNSASNDYQFCNEKQERPFDERDDNDEYKNIEQTLSDVAVLSNKTNATSRDSNYDRDDEVEGIKHSLSDTALKSGVGGSTEQGKMAPVDALDLEKLKKKKKRNRFKFWRRSRANNTKVSRFEKKHNDNSEVKFIECMTRKCHNYEDETDNDSYVSFRNDDDDHCSSVDGDETTVTSATSATTVYTQYTTDTARTPRDCSCINFIANVCLDELNGTFQDTTTMFRNAR